MCCARSMATAYDAAEVLRILRFSVRRRDEVEPLARFRNESEAHDYAMRVGVRDGVAPIVVEEGPQYDRADERTNRRFHDRRYQVGRREADRTRLLKRRA